MAFFVAGYFGVGWSVDGARAHDFGTVLDARIPFIASSVFTYLLVFPAALLPLFVVRCPLLFRRTLIGCATAIGVSLLVFVTIPVTSTHLRVDPASLDVTRFSPWAVAVLYRLDPPFNLFPSLHLSIAALTALAAFRAKRAYGAIAFLGVGLIAVSICTVKQHFMADALAGAALAAIVYAVVLRPYAPPPRTDPAYGWRGPAAYAALLIAVYAALYGWFLTTHPRSLP